MENRKVQAVGPSTLAVSLPKRWVESKDLKKGDRVFMVDDGDYLRLMTENGLNNNTKNIEEFIINADLCQEPGMLERIIVGNYVLGREKWTVKSQTKLKSEQHREIRDVAWRLIGLGIIEETADSMSLQCSIDPSKYPLKGLINRLYKLGATMFDESIEALLTNNKQLAEDVIKREDDADMIYWLSLKLILSAQMDDSLMEQIGLDNRREIAGYRLITKDLESIADHSEGIAQNVISLIKSDATFSTTLLDSISNLTSKVKDIYDKTLKALLEKDIEQANKALRMREDLRKQGEKIEKLMYEEVKDPFELLSIRKIMYDIQKISEFIFSISVITVNRYLEHSTDVCKLIDNR
jgi:phosphate uptake regulator